MLRRFAKIFIPLALAGCANPPEKPRPPVFDTQARFSVNWPGAPQTTHHPLAWWKNPDENLQTAIRALIMHSPAIRLAQTNIDEARALLLAAQAAEKPALDANTHHALEVGDNSNKRHSFSLDFTYPLDLFAKLSAQHDAASHILAQRLAEFEQTKLEQIETYLLALLDGIQARQTGHLVQQQIQSAQTLLQLIELRFAQGLNSSVDVLQQREQLAALRQQIPAFELQQRMAHNRISQLLGRTPSTQIHFPQALGIPVDAPFGLDQPTQLLDTRPDLLAKRAALAAQDSDYAATLKQRLPTLNLSLRGLLSLSSGDLSSLLSGMLNAGVNLLDHGRWQAQVDAQSARVQRAGLDYLSAWLDAVRQVDDLRNQALQNQAAIELAEQRLQIAEQLLRVSKQIYTQGIGDYLPVSNALRTLQQQQREHLNQVIQQQRIQIKRLIAIGLPAKDHYR